MKKLVAVEMKRSEDPLLDALETAEVIRRHGIRDRPQRQRQRPVKTNNRTHQI